MAAMRLACLLEMQSHQHGIPSVATVGTFSLIPGAINVVPGRARFSIDFRDADNAKLREADALLHHESEKLEKLGFRVNLRNVSRAASIAFNDELCCSVEAAASARNLSSLRMRSGASHDAQMMAQVCATTMIFVPSINGISHNPSELTDPVDLANGAQILSDVLWMLANKDSVS